MDYWKHSRWINDVDEFAKLVVMSRLASGEQVAELVCQFRCDPRATRRGLTTTDFSDFLVARHVLTFWQCHLLRNHQYKGFLLGGFKLLDFQSQADTDLYYLAEEIESGELVTLVVHPPRAVPRENGLPAYDVIRTEKRERSPVDPS
jgi:hypothetical protein